MIGIIFIAFVVVAVGLGWVKLFDVGADTGKALITAIFFGVAGIGLLQADIAMQSSSDALQTIGLLLVFLGLFTGIGGLFVFGLGSSRK
ncbi:hypothetical protein [Gorillibacterium sp. sgz500922]|uniref:hypothetical protein n=1 Tax=Gorillibacterium sp. sgz500922 TaxID=3446694 RepID=UPI003F678E23